MNSEQMLDATCPSCGLTMKRFKELLHKEAEWEKEKTAYQNYLTHLMLQKNITEFKVTKYQADNLPLGLCFAFMESDNVIHIRLLSKEEETGLN